MKAMLIANTPDKAKVLEVAVLSLETKVKNNKTYLWYYTKSDARADMADLKLHGVECEIKAGWENDGFFTLNL